jgi:hypothetical protein
VYAALLLGLSLLFLPALHAEGEWETAKTRVVKLDKNTEFSSVVYKPASVSGDMLELPVENGSGVKVSIKDNKVLVDVLQNGTPKFMASQGEMSKPFDLTLSYEDPDSKKPERVKHTFILPLVSGSFRLVRQDAMELTINKTKVWIVDENSNGIYGEANQDALYFDKKENGCPFGEVALIGDSLFEIKCNQAGTQVEFRPYAGKTGFVDVNKAWAGSKNPETVIVRNGDAFYDVACKQQVPLPVGDYKVHVAYLGKVVIDASSKGIEFQVSAEKTSEPEWGNKLTIQATCSFIAKTSKVTINSLPKIFGSFGEGYVGKYMEDGRFKIEVVPCTANGDPVGKATNWSMTTGGG